MATKSGTLVERAKQWAGYYGKYANGPEGAVITVPLRLRAAWENQDADAFAGMFVDNGHLVVGDDTLTSPAEIRDYVAASFAGDFADTLLDEEALEITLYDDDVALAVMEGGIVKDGQRSDAWPRHRSVYVTVKRDGDWRLLSMQISPVKE